MAWIWALIGIAFMIGFGALIIALIAAGGPPISLDEEERLMKEYEQRKTGGRADRGLGQPRKKQG